MEAMGFKGANVVFAEDQEEYLDLPAYRRPDGEITVCFRLTIKERFKILFTGAMWLDILTFNRALQPIRPSVDKPIDIGNNDHT